jgi:hypothetical protein
MDDYCTFALLSSFSQSHSSLFYSIITILTGFEHSCPKNRRLDTRRNYKMMMFFFHHCLCSLHPASWNPRVLASGAGGCSGLCWTCVHARRMSLAPVNIKIDRCNRELGGSRNRFPSRIQDYNGQFQVAMEPPIFKTRAE